MGKGLEHGLADVQVRMVKLILPGYGQRLGVDLISGSAELQFNP